VELVEEDALEGEQAILDEHDDRVSRLVVHVQQLVSTVTQAVVAPSVTTSGVRLPKISVPTLDGNVINWRSFGNNSQCLCIIGAIYLLQKSSRIKHAVKDGPAKHVVEGLSGSGDQYKQAVDSMCKWYDYPRLLHQAHVRAIIDAPSLKDGSGKELRRLHDTVNQHLRALMDYEPSGPFFYLPTRAQARSRDNV